MGRNNKVFSTTNTPLTMTNTLDASGLKQSYPNYYGQIEHVHTQQEQDAQTVPAETVLSDRIASRLEHDGLFTHQADALHALKRDENVCVSTSTSSGKTLIYALKIAENYLQNTDSTAMLVYPTKALSRDQKETLDELYETLGLDITVAVYDGDTPSNERPQIRENANVVITNFSGLNVYMPSYPKWSPIFKNMELIAIDESHSYTGVEGMHVSWIVRRFKRILAEFDATPQYVMTSATIGNPKEHSMALTGEEVTVIDNDGSPSGKRDIVFWNPPVIDGNEDDGIVERAPANQEATQLLTHLATRNVQTLMFSRARATTELNSERVKQILRSDDNPITGRDVTVEPYNAGHGKETRRNTEDKLKNGEIDGVISTNALELGIDIGSVDATVMCGYPGTRQSFWQQLGRSGRGTSDALSILVADYDNIDQYIMENPEYVLGDNIEDAVVDNGNNPVYAKHILCAAHEIPLMQRDKTYFGDDRLEKVVTMWKRAGKLVGDLESGVQFDDRTRPQSDVSLYATSDDQFQVRCENGSLDMEPIDRERAYREFHEGAVHLHRGDTYEVTSVNKNGKHPSVTLSKDNSIDHYTQTESDVTIRDLEKRESRHIGDFELCWGVGQVEAHYHSYVQKNIGSDTVIGGPFATHNDPIEMRTQMLWVEIPDDIEDTFIEQFTDSDDANDDENRAAPEEYLGGMHALEHGIIGMAPLELMMDRNDLGGQSVFNHPEFDNGAIIIYDGVPGGLGFSKSIYNQFETISAHTGDMINTCACPGVEGCPACVMSSNCGDNNEPLRTDVAVDLVSRLLDDWTPNQSNSQTPSVDNTY